MRSTVRFVQIIALTAIAGVAVQSASAQQNSGGQPAAKSSTTWQPLSLTQAPPPPQPAPPPGGAKAAPKSAAGAPVDARKDEFVYKEVSDFFNIREANANMKKCEWEFEETMAWMTYHSRKHHDDDFTMTESLKYGITDDLFVEVEVLPINLGDGDHLDGGGRPGWGETEFTVFWQFLHEKGIGCCPPAMAVWGEMRVPTGCNSSKVDGTLHLTLTKTICKGFRAHLDGFVETDNGSRGDEDRYGDRRHFQWGVGPGVDYEINKCNLVTFNYLNRVSDNEGSRNNNLLEAGWVYMLSEHQVIKVAVDAECHAKADGPHWLTKVQWGISW